MSVLRIKNQEFPQIKMVLVDIGGTLINYNELWLRQFGYIAQLIAESHSKFQGELFRTRAMAMKALGVDPETAEIDFNGPFFSLSEEELYVALTTVLYLNKVKFTDASTTVQKIFEKMDSEIDKAAYISLYDDSVSFINRLKGFIKLGCFSKNSFDDLDKIIDLFNILSVCDCRFSGSKKPVDNVFSCHRHFYKAVMDEVQLDSSEIMVVADSINDLSFCSKYEFVRVLVNRNNINPKQLKPETPLYVVDTLDEIVF